MLTASAEPPLTQVASDSQLWGATVADAQAVLSRVPEKPASMVPVMTMVAVWPTSRVPIVHVTSLATSSQGAAFSEVAVLSLHDALPISVIVTLWAVEGPLLVTVMV